MQGTAENPMDPSQVNPGLLYWLAAQVEAKTPVLVNVEQGVWDALMELLKKEAPKSETLQNLQNELQNKTPDQLRNRLVHIVTPDLVREWGAETPDGKVNLAKLLRMIHEKSVGAGNAFLRAVQGNAPVRISAFDLERVDVSGLNQDLVERILLTISGIPLRVLSKQMEQGQEYDKLKKFIAQFA
jgi:hypothetical protein